MQDYFILFYNTCYIMQDYFILFYTYTDRRTLWWMVVGVNWLTLYQE